MFLGSSRAGQRLALGNFAAHDLNNTVIVQESVLSEGYHNSSSIPETLP
jgi:hypothetical protein